MRFRKLRERYGYTALHWRGMVTLPRQKDIPILERFSQETTKAIKKSTTSQGRFSHGLDRYQRSRNVRCGSFDDGRSHSKPSCGAWWRPAQYRIIASSDRRRYPAKCGIGDATQPYCSAQYAIEKNISLAQKSQAGQRLLVRSRHFPGNASDQAIPVVR